MTTYNFKASQPWKPYAGRNIKDRSDLVHLIYEVDTQTDDKNICLIIFKEVLRPVSKMTEVLLNCEKNLRKDVGDTWKLAARALRDQKIENLERKVLHLEDALQNAVARNQSDLSDAEMSRQYDQVSRGNFSYSRHERESDQKRPKYEN
jgi:hypothetical protein